MLRADPAIGLPSACLWQRRHECLRTNNPVGMHRNGHTPGLRWVSELNMTTRLPHLFPAITTQRAQ